MPLLKLAAKAAGYVEGETFKFHPATGRPVTRQAFGQQWRDWNPLYDDGDALRLAVKLGLRLDIENNYSRTHASRLPDGICATVLHDDTI